MPECPLLVMFVLSIALFLLHRQTPCGREHISVSNALVWACQVTVILNYIVTRKWILWERNRTREKDTCEQNQQELVIDINIVKELAMWLWRFGEFKIWWERLTVWRFRKKLQFKSQSRQARYQKQPTWKAVCDRIPSCLGVVRLGFYFGLSAN